MKMVMTKMPMQKICWKSSQIWWTELRRLVLEKNMRALMKMKR
jgi:hypothetical protein